MEQNFSYGAPSPYGDTLQNKFEKKYIRKLGLAVGLAVIILALVSRFWSTVVLWAIDYFGISHTLAARILENEGIQQLEQIIFSVLCFTFPFIIAAMAANEKVSVLIPYKKPKKGTAFPYLLMGISFCTFANFAVNLAGSFFEDIGVNYEVTRSPLPTGTVGFLIYLSATAVIPAMVEEFACRGIVLGLMKPFGEGFAVIASSLVFGMVHGNFEQIPFAFLVGLVLGFIRVKTDSMIICMAVHFINNAVSVVLTYILEANVFPDEAVNTVYLVFMAFALLLGIIGVILIRDKGDLNFEESRTLSTEKQKFLWFFTSPAIIIFVLIELINSSTYFVTG